MSQESHLTTKVTKYALRSQAYICERKLFETFVFCLGALGGKIYSLWGQPQERKTQERALAKPKCVKIRKI